MPGKSCEVLSGSARVQIFGQGGNLHRLGTGIKTTGNGKDNRPTQTEPAHHRVRRVFPGQWQELVGKCCPNNRKTRKLFIIHLLKLISAWIKTSKRKGDNPEVMDSISGAKRPTRNITVFRG